MIAAISLTLRKRRDVKYNDPAAAVRVRAADRVRLVDLPSQEAVNAKSGDKA
jgi:NADH-quinone oxidoreductase subunit J